ncbi:MAG TPA: toll/interleukin-1 receptor domain-containing protein [Anaerolineales bacterium]|nr:toll/interleukin-1 receptor domain-containing protein [Anaerolineales bacterium]
MTENSPSPELPLPPSVHSVFISYAREDVSWAQERARVLRAVRIRVFLDLDSLRAGDPWPIVLQEEVERADLVWLGWSKYSAQSEWVRREYQAALAKGPGRLRIDLLDDTQLPPELANIQAERAMYWQPRVERMLRDPARNLPDDLGQPSVLLRPEYGVVPFTGRGELLDSIHGWCASARPFSARLYVGPGGSGKTRLMIQACQAMRERGWDARFLDSKALEESVSAEPEILDQLFLPRLPRLLVMDYAETRRRQLEALLDRGLRKDAGQPVRLILLARTAADWWRELLASRYEYQELLGSSAEPVAVPPLTPDLPARQRVFDAAVTAMAQVLGTKGPPASPPDLSRETFGRVLFLHMAALAFVLGERLETPADLLDLILEHERRYWLRMAQDVGLAPSLHSTLEGAAALIVLAGGCASADALLDLLSRSPELGETRVVERKQVASVFRNLYSVAASIEPLQPDLLGEHLVAKAFGEDRGLRVGWIRGADADQIRSGLTVLNRTADGRPEADAWLLEVLSSDLERLAAPAIEAAIEGGDPIGRLLAQALNQSPMPALAHGLEASLPHETVSLRELAAEVTQQAIQHLESARDVDAEERKSGRARLLNNLGVRLSELGRREEALFAAQEAVGVYRKLAEARPEAFLPDLARSLNSLGNQLSELGRREEALAAAQEAVGGYRKLAEARPDAFLPNLTLSLNNLGTFLSELGRREEALAAVEQAVEGYRKLAEARPEAYLPLLAASLNNLGNCLSELGRREEALAAAQEAVEGYRKLAEARPDAFLPDLAGSLNNLGNRLSKLWRREVALAATEQAVAIQRRLAEARPDAFLPDLAANLNNLGNWLSALGRREEALAATEQAVEVYRKLAEARPDAFLPNLALSLNNLGTFLSQLGRREEALAAAQEAVRILLPFLRAAPSAFEVRARTMLRNYIRYAEDAKKEPDPSLIIAVTEILGLLGNEDE